MDAPATRKSTFRLFMKLNGWIALIPLLIALVTGSITLSEGQKAQRLAKDGAVAQATVINLRRSFYTDSDGDQRTRHHMEFAFDARGRSYQMEQTVGRGLYTRMNVGDTTEIRYWRPDPTVNEIEPGTTTTTIWVTKIASALSLAGGLFWINRSWKRASRAARVRDRGTRRRATVTHHIKTNVRINKVPQYRLAWQDEEGTTGKSWFVSGRQLGDWPEGAELTVYADPTGKFPSVWERDVGARRDDGTGAVRRR